VDMTKLNWQERQERYQSEALELSRKAALLCLDGRAPSDIGAVVYGSCTGFAPGPTIPHYLGKSLGFSPAIYYTNIIGQGCESGFPGLKRAYDFAVATGKSALVINCELSSLAYFPEPSGRPDPENDYELLRANSIFADAASCALVGFDDDPRHPFIVDTETYTNTDYIDALGFVWREGRLRVLLSRRLSEFAPLVVKPAVDTLLKCHNLTVNNIAWWVIHAAGSRVLDSIRNALGIAEEKVRLSRETLRLFGNTSSTSVGITGKRLIAQNIKPGDYALVLSVGPGMSGGASLLRFGG
ncbi:unnamed protein product, partial [marine sediment metagenome]